MFVKINRINEQNHVKEIVVDTDEIVFVTETEPHINYDEPIEWETKFDDEMGQIQVATKWTETPRYIIAFKNGRHPQFLDKENYDKLVDALTK